MTIIQVGLGSMGKRRIRCLKRLGVEDIVGFDFREDRRREVEEKYGVKTVAQLRPSDFERADALVISTPPDKHLEYIRQAVAHGRHAFVEASVILEGLEEIRSAAAKKKILIAPSCTLRFHPAIKDIKRLVKSGDLGRPTSFTYYSGQYLPDWHPWENVKDFYVSNKVTGACREIVPFELTWLSDILGLPRKISALYGRTMDVGAPIDDTYVLAMQFESCFGSLIVDVVARYAMRSLLLNLEHGQIQWRWDEPVVRAYDARARRWVAYNAAAEQAQAGYNKNIGEEMYVEELGTFLSAMGGKCAFPNTLEDDMDVLKILYRAEGRAF